MQNEEAKRISKIIFDKACEILAEVENSTEEDGQFSNGEKFEDVKVDMLNKLVQLQRKNEEVECLDSLVEPYGHKYLSAVKLAREGESKECRNVACNKKEAGAQGEGRIEKDGENDSKEIRGSYLGYCVIMMCMYGWVLHKTSTNETINRIVKVLHHLKKKYMDLYIEINNMLYEFELPFREGGEYSRFLIYFPERDIDSLDKERCWKLFSKTEGMRFEDEVFREKIKKVREQNKQWEKLSGEEKEDVENAVKAMLWHNKAIYLMLFFQLHGSVRLRYSRECERITSSVSFRYMQYKAQVMFNNASDDQRTRLTHTLEVAGVAKTIAKQLGCNWQLVEAMALGHDLGHVPFGHQGEEALDECLHQAWAGRFAHSLQSVNVLGDLAQHATVFDQFGVNGLCLSRPVLEGVLKHDTDNLLHDIRRASWRLQYNGWREALIRKNSIEIKNGEKTKKTDEPEWYQGLSIGGLETQIVYWADKIAYAGHDWDEFAQSGLLDQMTQDIDRILKRMHQLRHMAHGRATGKKEKISDITSEVDLIRFIRYHIEQIRGTITAPKEKEEETSENEEVGSGASVKRFAAAFKANKDVAKYDAKEDAKKVRSLEIFIEKREGEERSPLACFVEEYLFLMERYIKNPERKWSLKFFTVDEYELILDFFTVAHDLIYLTEVFPRPYKKSDDVVWILCHYLLDIDNRCMVQALQPKLIRNSRMVLASVNTEVEVLEHGMEAFLQPVKSASEKLPSIFHDTVKSLSDARTVWSELGYIEERDNPFRREKKELKKWFRETMQKKMYIRMEDGEIFAHNRISGFVQSYYIGSERVRIMKHKAHKIIRKLFEFFMGHEDMLPTEYRHRIAFDAQKLSMLEDEFAGVEGKRFLVIQYLFERLQENQRCAGKNGLCKIFDNTTRGAQVPEGLLREVVKCFTDCADFDKANADIEKVLKTAALYPQFLELCEHIAKARVITDYLSTMTDRYAEKKYNEIVSSSTSWSLSFHE